MPPYGKTIQYCEHRRKLSAPDVSGPDSLRLIGGLKGASFLLNKGDLPDIDSIRGGVYYGDLDLQFSSGTSARITFPRYERRGRKYERTITVGISANSPEEVARAEQDIARYAERGNRHAELERVALGAPAAATPELTGQASLF